MLLRRGETLKPISYQASFQPQMTTSIGGPKVRRSMDGQAAGPNERGLWGRRLGRRYLRQGSWWGLVVGLLCGLGCQSADSGLPSPAELGEQSDVSRNSPPAPTGRDPSEQTPSGGWPLWRGDPAGTGLATSVLPEKLQRRWTFRASSGGFEATAVIADGTVYIGSTDGPFYAIDLRTGQKRWEFTEGAGYFAPAAVTDQMVFVGDVQGRFFALRSTDGQKAWHFDAEAEINGGPNFYQSWVLFGSQDGCLYCLERTTGRLVWKYQSPDQIRCFPTIWNGHAMVAGCDGQLHAIDLQTGKPTGQVNLQGPTGSTPAVLADCAFVGTEARRFLAIDLKQAKVLWTFESPKNKQAFRASAALTSEAVYVGCRDRHVYALDIKTGQLLWQFATRGQVDSSPVVVGDRLFVGSEDGRLYSLDRRTGNLLWQFDLGGQIVASPAVAEGCLVIANTDGQLSCFGALDAPGAPSSSHPVALPFFLTMKGLAWKTYLP